MVPVALLESVFHCSVPRWLKPPVPVTHVVSICTVQLSADFEPRPVQPVSSVVTSISAALTMNGAACGPHVPACSTKVSEKLPARVAQEAPAPFLTGSRVHEEMQS